jgi:hypothetical protein
MDVRLRLTGHQDVDKVLRGLPLQVNHRVLQAAHTSAAKVLVTAEKLAAPEGPTGNLVDSIGVIKTPFGRAGALGEINVGPRRGRYKGYAAHLVEYGTKRRSYRGANRGVMPKRPFALPSWMRVKDKVESLIAGHLSRHLLNFMRRTIKRHG